MTKRLLTLCLLLAGCASAPPPVALSSSPIPLEPCNAPSGANWQNVTCVPGHIVFVMPSPSPSPPWIVGYVDMTVDGQASGHVDEHGSQATITVSLDEYDKFVPSGKPGCYIKRRYTTYTVKDYYDDTAGMYCRSEGDTNVTCPTPPPDRAVTAPTLEGALHLFMARLKSETSQ